MIYLNKNYNPDSQGWVFYQQQTDWWNPIRLGGFKLSVEAIQAHRKKHLEIVKAHNLSLDFDSIADELLKYTSKRTGIPICEKPATSIVSGPTVCKIDKTGFPTIEEIKKACEHNPLSPDKRITVVVPPCHKDAQLTISNLKWQKRLDGKKDFRCVLAVDSSMPSSFVSIMKKIGSETYADISIFTYPRPKTNKWPNAPNWAFQSTARHMQKLGNPWFWMEPDCIPISKGWLPMLNQEYAMCQKPIMGSIIGGMGHCNGTAIYPYDFCELSRKAMSCSDMGWDMEMKDETIHLTHPSKLMYHIWGIAKGVAVQNGGSPVFFRTWDEVKQWVDLDCVVVHRCKNTSLIERMKDKV